MNLSKLRDTMWRRHANPWSVWTRLLSAPLMYVPFWNRSWKHGLAVAAWFTANPFLFQEPEDSQTWAARAIRGEQRWVKERPRDIALAVQTAGAAATMGGLYTAYKHRLWPTVASAVVVIACNAWFLNRMTVYAEKNSGENQGVG